VASFDGSIVLFESPNRLGRVLADAAEVLGDRRAAVARELTKVHEEWARGTLPELAERFSGPPVKGECTLVIEGVTRRKA
jgi:16S rRNA (cytidine1402-2'-O)-methyltransferase